MRAEDLKSHPFFSCSPLSDEEREKYAEAQQQTIRQRGGMTGAVSGVLKLKSKVIEGEGWGRRGRGGEACCKCWWKVCTYTCMQHARPSLYQQIEHTIQLLLPICLILSGRFHFSSLLGPWCIYNTPTFCAVRLCSPSSMARSMHVPSSHRETW